MHYTPKRGHIIFLRALQYHFFLWSEIRSRSWFWISHKSDLRYIVAKKISEFFMNFIVTSLCTGKKKIKWSADHDLIWKRSPIHQWSDFSLMFSFGQQTTNPWIANFGSQIKIIVRVFLEKNYASFFFGYTHIFIQIKNKITKIEDNLTSLWIFSRKILITILYYVFEKLEKTCNWGNTWDYFTCCSMLDWTTNGYEY